MVLKVLAQFVHDANMESVVSCEPSSSPSPSVWSHVTLVVSTKYLFLGQENHDQWPMSKLQRPPEKASLRPPFSNVVYKEITDVEKLVSL